MKRPPNMSFEEYKKIRKNVNNNIKFYLRGARIWDSGPSWKSFRGLPSQLDSQGNVIPWPSGKTYVKAKHGPIGHDKTTGTHS